MLAKSKERQGFKEQKRGAVSKQVYCHDWALLCLFAQMMAMTSRRLTPPHPNTLALKGAGGNDSSGTYTVADGNGGSSRHVAAGDAGCGSSRGEHCALRLASKKAATGTADTSLRAMPAAAAAGANIGAGGNNSSARRYF